MIKLFLSIRFSVQSYTLLSYSYNLFRPFLHTVFDKDVIIICYIVIILLLLLFLYIIKE